MLLPAEEVAEEALVAAVDMELLHRRLGHMGKTAMIRLGKEVLDRWHPARPKLIWCFAETSYRTPIPHV